MKKAVLKKAVLKKPEALTLRTWITCGMALYGLVEYTDRKMSLPMVMGLSHAFRLTIVPDEIHIAGPTMFDFGEVLQQGLHNTLPSLPLPGWWGTEHSG